MKCHWLRPVSLKPDCTVSPFIYCQQAFSAQTPAAGLPPQPSPGQGKTPGLLFPTPSEDFPHTGLRSLSHPPPHRFMQRPRQGDIMMLSPVSVTFFFLDALPGCERHNRRLLWHRFSKARMEWGAARSKRPLCDCTFCSSLPHPHWRSVAMAKCVPSWEARDRGLSCGLSFVSKHCSSRCRFPHLCNDDFALNLCDSALEFLSGPACLRIPCGGQKHADSWPLLRYCIRTLAGGPLTECLWNE